MKILITGAMGHIGSKLIRQIALWDKDYELILIDNMHSERYCSLFNLPGRLSYTFIEADLRKIELSKLLCQVDLVIHLAAITNAERSILKRN